MFTIGEKIMYGGTGVCVVENVVSMKASAASPIREYYVLRPLFQSGTIHAPVDSDKVPIRAVLSRAETIALIDRIPDIQAEACNEKNLSALRNYYQSQINSFNCEDLIRMCRGIHIKRMELEARQKKIGLTDEKYLRRARELLFGEFAVALDIPMNKVEEFISSRLQKA